MGDSLVFSPYPSGDKTTATESFSLPLQDVCQVLVPSEGGEEAIAQYFSKLGEYATLFPISVIQQLLHTQSKTVMDEELSKNINLVRFSSVETDVLCPILLARFSSQTESTPKSKGSKKVVRTSYASYGDIRECIRKILESACVSSRTSSQYISPEHPIVLYVTMISREFKELSTAVSKAITANVSSDVAKVGQLVDKLQDYPLIQRALRWFKIALSKAEVGRNAKEKILANVFTEFCKHRGPIPLAKSKTNAINQVTATRNEFLVELFKLVPIGEETTHAWSRLTMLPDSIVTFRSGSTFQLLQTFRDKMKQI